MRWIPCNPRSPTCLALDMLKASVIKLYTSVGLGVLDRTRSRVPRQLVPHHKLLRRMDGGTEQEFHDLGEALRQAGQSLSELLGNRSQCRLRVEAELVLTDPGVVRSVMSRKQPNRMSSEDWRYEVAHIASSASFMLSRCFATGMEPYLYNVRPQHLCRFVEHQLGSVGLWSMTMSGARTPTSRMATMIEVLAGYRSLLYKVLGLQTSGRLFPLETHARVDDKVGFLSNRHGLAELSVAQLAAARESSALGLPGVGSIMRDHKEYLHLHHLLEFQESNGVDLPVREDGTVDWAFILFVACLHVTKEWCVMEQKRSTTIHQNTPQQTTAGQYIEITTSHQSTPSHTTAHQNRMQSLTDLEDLANSLIEKVHGRKSDLGDRALLHNRWSTFISNHSLASWAPLQFPNKFVESLHGVLPGGLPGSALLRWATATLSQREEMGRDAALLQLTRAAQGSVPPVIPQVRGGGVQAPHLDGKLLIKTSVMSNMASWLSGAHAGCPRAFEAGSQCECRSPEVIQRVQQSGVSLSWAFVQGTCLLKARHYQKWKCQWSQSEFDDKYGELELDYHEHSSIPEYSFEDRFVIPSSREIAMTVATYVHRLRIRNAALDALNRPLITNQTFNEVVTDVNFGLPYRDSHLVQQWHHWITNPPPPGGESAERQETRSLYNEYLATGVTTIDLEELRQHIIQEWKANPASD